MTTFQIRLIAIIAMAIDHVGLFFFPDLLVFRVIGRLSFPLFSWLLANGIYHTHNSTLYLKRLFALACISQVPFFLANILIGKSFWYFNVVFTLCLGLSAVLLIQKIKTLSWKVWAVAIILLIAYFFNTDYSFVGVLSIICFYLFYNSPRRMIVSQIAVFSLPVLINIINKASTHELSQLGLYNFSALGGLLIALMCVHFYNGREGLKAKYFFYIFYPVQYIVILILLLIGRN